MSQLTLAAEARTEITVVKWWPLRSGSLRGFANVHVEKFKLVIHGCPVNEANGRRWASLPGKVQIGKDGEIIRKDTGKPSYLPMGTCADDSHPSRFLRRRGAGRGGLRSLGVR